MSGELNLDGTADRVCLLTGLRDGSIATWAVSSGTRSDTGDKLPA
jgi:hypothetical protein